MRNRPILVLFLLFHVSALISAQTSKVNSTSSWLTLKGDPPLVIAKGGFSGLFPDSSLVAYNLATTTSLSNFVLWCDVQLTKDGFGICLPDINLQNSTDISFSFPKGARDYLVNGKHIEGYFSIDFTAADLISNVTLVQRIYYRTNVFDTYFPIVTVEDVAGLKPSGFWLNIQHSLFYEQHNLSMRAYVISVSRRVIVNYISSPEVAFLRSIGQRFNGSKTKLVFRFLGAGMTEPSTNQAYGLLLKNLTFVKTFASGILVPKDYIWPMNSDLYLQPYTAVVLDAHREGLEVFASDFANDVALSYNYSYDPIAEYLHFVDNTKFSVDGVLTDFPITSSAAIGCFSHINGNSSENGNLLVISHNGASGDYAGSTNLAYQKAVHDGSDILDCSVQMTKDGILICLNSIDLLDSTTVSTSPFSSLMTSIPEIQGSQGIFTFNLTWAQIQNLQPVIANPYVEGYLYRNPAYKNVGKFMTLSEFLSFSKGKPLSGILINIENAVYLAKKQGVSIADSVINALSDAGYANQTGQQVMIMSSDSSVLIKFKEQTKYKLIYKVDDAFRDALNSTVQDIKKFADAVALTKSSIFTVNRAFITGSTGLVEKMKAFNLSVYAYLFQNEFLSQSWDFFADPNMEIHNFFMGAGVDGVITDFPRTSKAYLRNSCLKMSEAPPYMSLVQPGGLYQSIPPMSLPPAQAPLPLLTEKDVIEAPLPSVSAKAPGPATGEATVTPPVSPPNGQPGLATTNIFLPMAMLLLSSLLTLV